MTISNEASYISLGVSILLIVFGQIMIKLGTRTLSFDWNSIPTIFKSVFTNRELMIGLAATLCSPVFYFIALRNIDLSVAFGVNSLNYLLVSAAGWLIFGELFSWKKGIGVLLIVLGVFLISMGGS